MAALTLQADDAGSAEELAMSLLTQALPSVEFTDMIAERETEDRVMRHPLDPSCSFCGKPQRRVRKLIAGPGVYVCDECVEMMVEIVNEDQPAQPGKPPD